MQTQTSRNIEVNLATGTGKPEVIREWDPGLWFKNFVTRIFHWEFWPFNLLYTPVFFYWVWLVVKARSPYFFYASNPGIEYGGMLGESKSKILGMIPDDLKPKTLLFGPDDPLDLIREKLEADGLDFPLLAKPDIGERGWMVTKIDNLAKLQDYLQRTLAPFLIQEYIDLPVELGIFYYRYPGAEKGTISSITTKEFLEVKGDGRHTVYELMRKDPRASLQLKAFKQREPELLIYIPQSGEKLKLVPIGNHCRGTKFLNGENLIDERLISSFDQIAKYIPGFYFGRFDIRCKNLEDLYNGKVKILELNGAGSEPTHIYQPGFPLGKAYGVILSHLKVLFEISRENHINGVKYPSLNEGWAFVKQLRAYRKLQNQVLNG